VTDPLGPKPYQYGTLVPPFSTNGRLISYTYTLPYIEQLEGPEEATIYILFARPCPVSVDICVQVLARLVATP